MNKFDILLSEINECKIRTQSQEVVNTLNYLEHFANGLGDGWISIDDELPKVAGRYLCYCSSNQGQFFEQLSEKMANDKEYLIAIGVTHWQPLPQPPKE